MSFQVTKASGEVENFDEGKLIQNLKWSNVPDDIASAAVAYVKNKIEDRVSTQKIHDYVQEYFQQNKLLRYSLSYDLKRALMRFGPSGYPFEKFVAKILSVFGYSTQSGIIIQGKCVTHEIDVDAQREGHRYLIECKFHNQPGIKTDIQVALYTYARFLDVRSALESQTGYQEKYHQAWLVTNTKVTNEVIDYANCMDMKVLSWGYPKEGNLQELVISSHLHPVTVLQGLSVEEQQNLYEHNIVTCADLKQAIDNNELPPTYTNELKQSLLSQISSICA